MNIQRRRLILSRTGTRRTESMFHEHEQQEYGASEFGGESVADYQMKDVLRVS
jgi:hypothetical protein